MKVALFFVALCLVEVYTYTCSSRGDCDASVCATGNEIHCMDGTCKCTTNLGEGAPCREDDQCEQHGSDKCGPLNSLEWKCVHNTCHCVH